MEAIIPYVQELASKTRAINPVHCSYFAGLGSL